MARRQSHPVYKEVEIIDTSAEGKGVARVDEKVVFVWYAVPGDIVDIQITKKRRQFLEGRIIQIHKESPKRAEAFCSHFGLCGGCKWQHMNYADQLHFKQKQVLEQLKRIAKVDLPNVEDIIPSEKTRYYRNKLEYTFSNHKWLVEKPVAGEEIQQDMNGLGFHIPGMFDRIVDIDHCYLQADPSNMIRLALKSFAAQQGPGFYDVKKWEGFYRNVIIRNTPEGEIMVVVVFHYHDKEAIHECMFFLERSFPEVISWYYVVNTKKNDDISDLQPRLFAGDAFITELIPSPIAGRDPLKFRVGPLSFFQTNSLQAANLYRIAFDFAEFQGDEVVYDLYCGTGTIGSYVAASVRKVIGIEYIQEAVEHAVINSHINSLDNLHFYAGDIASVLTDDFIQENGTADVVITDPPRAGMHDKVTEQLLHMAPARIVYISCNPATQARDIAMLAEKYSVKRLQPLDMFPHTHHVENVALLTIKQGTL